MATLDIQASEDTSYGTTYSAGPNGSSTALQYGGWGDYYYAFLKFILTSAPPNAQITKVELFIDNSSPSVNDAQNKVYRITSTWAESTLSRTVVPSVDGTSQGQLPTSASAGWKSLDITTLVKAWIAGTYANYGLSIRPAYNTNSAGSFSSRESANIPYLRFTYTPVDPVISPTTSAFDLKLSTESDLAITITENGNALTSIDLDGGDPIDPSAYTYTGGVVTFTKEVLRYGLPVGVYALNFNFANGYTKTLTLTVTDTANHMRWNFFTWT